MALTQRDKTLLAVLAGMAVVAGLYYTVNWYTKTRAALVSQRDKLASELSHVREKVRNMAMTRQKLEEARQLQVDLERKVPPSEEVPQLLRDLADMMTAAGANLESFKPGRPAPSSLPEWMEIKVSVNVSGTYRALALMFDNLQRAKRLIGVSKFDINGGGTEANPVLQCNLDLLVYCTK